MSEVKNAEKLRLPFKVINAHDGYFVSDNFGIWVTGYCEEDRASFIVTACNSHYELLEACEKSLDCFKQLINIGIDTSTVIAYLDKAISKAQGDL